METLACIHSKIRTPSVSAVETKKETISWPVTGHRAVESTSCQHTNRSRGMKGKLIVKYTDKTP